MKKIVLFSMVALTALFIACANPAGGNSKNPTDPDIGDVTPTTPEDEEDPVIPPENAKTFKLTLKAGDSSSETVEFDVYEKTSTRIPLSGFTKEGYYIAGWSENENAAEPQYKVTEKLVFTGNKTLYAVWADATGLIKITYNFDDDSGEYMEQYCEPNVPYYLEIGFEKRSDDKLEITNYWVNSENKVYTPGCYYTFTESINLYASWVNPTKANKIYFHKNDGTDTYIVKYYRSETYISGIEKIVDYEREGYTFVGWGETPDTNQPFNTELFLNISGKYEEKHYYAIWQNSVEIKVSYYRSSNGINGNYETEGKKQFTYSLEEAKNIIIADNFFTEDVPEGKVFAGWTDMLLNEMLEDSKKTVPYYAGKKVNTTRDLNLFPVYLSPEVAASKSVQITFHSNYEGSTDSFSVYVFVDSMSEQLNYPVCPYSREGYVFNGWSSYNTGTSGIKPDDKNTYYVYKSNKQIDYYATWINAIKVTYNANDGSENPETVDVYEGYNDYHKFIENPFVSPSSDLYFVGWSKSPDSVKPDYYVGSDDHYIQDTVLYAVWKPNVTVIFDANYIEDGETESKKITVVAPEYSKVKVPEFIREHYEFTGLTKNSGFTSSINNSKYNIEAYNGTYYAVWNRYREIRFYNNDGTDEYTSVYAEKTIYFRDYIPVREGYSFVGWGQTKTDTKPVDKWYVDRTTDSYERPYNYYAIWTQEKVTINFYFSPTSSKDDVKLFDTKEVLKYSAVVFEDLNLTIPENEHFTFKEWWTIPENGYSSTVYRDEISRIEKNLELYTIWSEDPCITYYPNFETDQEPVKQYFPESGVVDLRLNTFVREGYGFAGWSYSSNSNYIYKYDGAKNVSASSSGSYYAVWKENPTITFNANDETDEPETVTEKFDYNKQIPVPACPFTREGYTFLGWSEDTGSWEKLSYAAGTTTSFTNSKTLYAVWVKDSQFITITFDANFIEEGQTESKKVYIRAKPKKTYYIPAEAKAFTREGYKLASYFYGDPVSTSDFNNGTQSSYADKTWYAHWKKCVTVTYNLNDGSENPILLVQDGVEGENVYITSETPEKEGYTFKGWSKSPSATRASYTYSSSSSITMTTEDLVLYAVWKKK